MRAWIRKNPVAAVLIGLVAAPPALCIGGACVVGFAEGFAKGFHRAASSPSADSSQPAKNDAAAAKSAPTPTAGELSPELHRLAEETTALLNFKATLQNAGMWPQFIDAAELDQKMPNRVLIRVTPSFERASRSAKNQFAQKLEATWSELRRDAGATQGRSLILIVSPAGERLGGSTVLGLAEMNE